MEYNIVSVKKCLLQMADVAIRSKELLTRLDCMCGDGDLGISMELGAQVVRHVVDQYSSQSISELLAICAVNLNREAPSTMGTLICKSMATQAGLMTASQNLSDETIVQMPRVFSQAIMLVGGAQRGDKTVLDALIPLAEEFHASYARTGNLPEAARRACEAAVSGAMATKGCLARIGRAKWFAERSKNCPDGGAVFCALMMQAAVGAELLPIDEWYTHEDRRLDYVRYTKA